MLLRQRNQAGFAALLEPVTLAANVQRGGMMQQPIQDRRRDNRIAEDGTPFAVALVGSQNDAAPFVASADQLKEDRRTDLVQWQISHFIDKCSAEHL